MLITYILHSSFSTRMNKTIFLVVVVTVTFSGFWVIQKTPNTNSALAQVTATTNDTFSMGGAISSLVLGMPANSTTVDMSTVQKFILSGDWNMSADEGKLTDFMANFYTGPANGGTSNHTHQLSNFRVNKGDVPIQLTPDKSVSISGILDVGTNGNSAWNDVNTTLDVSNGRTISIRLADEDSDRHFMGQQIYGIVEKLDT
jgi:hypothetical protein